MKKLAGILIFLLLLTGCGLFTNNPIECDDNQTLVDGVCVDDEDPNPEIIDFSEVYPNNNTYYQIFVRSFADSDNDGVGDFNGITAKLGYLKDLGVTAIWLMPMHPSDTYHGYDVRDYYDVNPEYGTMADFENLLEVSEEMGIDIIIDFLINHTSVNHPWFQGWLAGDE